MNEHIHNHHQPKNQPLFLALSIVLFIVAFIGIYIIKQRDSTLRSSSISDCTPTENGTLPDGCAALKTPVTNTNALVTAPTPSNEKIAEYEKGLNTLAKPK